MPAPIRITFVASEPAHRRRRRVIGWSRVTGRFRAREADGDRGARRRRLHAADAARDRPARPAGLRHELRHHRLSDERAMPRIGLPERLAAAEEAVINPLAHAGANAPMAASARLWRSTRCRCCGPGRRRRSCASSSKGKRAAGRTGLRRRAGLHPGRVDRLQLFRPWADPADRGRRAGADRGGRLPAATLARRASAARRRACDSTCSIPTSAR